MSLINDMLRDLDARRRDAPGHGAGPEKLVPAPSSSSHRGSSSLKNQLGWIGVVVLLLIALGTAFWFLRGSGAEQRTLAPVQVATPENEASESSGVQQPASSDAEATTIAELERRLQDLERQNQLLANEQALPDSGQTSETSTQNVQRTEANVPTIAPAQASGSWQPRNWESEAHAQQQPAVSSPQSQTAGSQERASEAAASVANATSEILAPAARSEAGDSSVSEQSSGIVREQRALSLNERDRREVQTALEQWADGQRMAALQTLDSFIYQEPEAHLSREMLAKLLIQQGEPERALQAVELGLRIAPNQAAYKKIKARLLVDAGQAQQAADVLLQRPPQMSADIEYHDMLATALLASQNFREAITTYQALLRQNDAVGRWWYGLAVALDTIGRRPEAADAYQQAARRDDLPAALREQSRERLALIRAAQ